MSVKWLRFGCCLVLAVCLAGGPSRAWAESQHVFGIHFWEWGANVDVMNHRTGWTLEANVTRGGNLPNVPDRYEPMAGEGFTIAQRLDWEWGSNSNDQETVPTDPAEQDIFASQCATWASMLKKHCRHYVIGNEMEIAGPVSASQYASAFEKVRTAIQNVQPEARVIIGHFMEESHIRSCLQALGRDGYDGVGIHTPSSVPDGVANILDDPDLHPEGPARPGVGIYVTEWGWCLEGDGVPENPQPIMEGFYSAVANWNATENRQVYCACWFVYATAGAWYDFSLQLHPVENAAFEATQAPGTCVNAYANNPVIMSNLYADVPDSGQSIQCSWQTNVPARRQAWWRLTTSPQGTSSTLNDTLSTTHGYTISGLWSSREYEVMPTSTKDNFGDAGGRRFLVKTGPWSSDVTQTGVGRVVVHWNTDWAADSRVDYGPTTALGESVLRPQLVTDHEVQITGLDPGQHYYRFMSSQDNPDPNGPRLYMRSPATPPRTFTVEPWYCGDMDTDCDVDQEDFGLFQACYSGSGFPQDDTDCWRARLDDDDDVDQTDFSIFQKCFSTPGLCGSLQCPEN